MSFFDIQTQIIPGIDPDCSNISNALNILNKFYSNGITKICASPFLLDVRENNVEQILFDIKKEANNLDNFKIPEIFSCIEYPLNHQLLDSSYNSSDIKNNSNLKTINGTRFIMVKVPHENVPNKFEQSLKNLRSKGYIPIINNSENNSSFITKFKLFEKVAEIGCFININLKFMILDSSKRNKKIIKKLFKNKMIHLISGFSDFDSTNLQEVIKEFCFHNKTNYQFVTKVLMGKNPDLIANSSKIKPEFN